MVKKHRLTKKAMEMTRMFGGDHNITTKIALLKKVHGTISLEKSCPLDWKMNRLTRLLIIKLFVTVASSEPEYHNVEQNQ